MIPEILEYTDPVEGFRLQLSHSLDALYSFTTNSIPSILDIGSMVVVISRCAIIHTLILRTDSFRLHQTSCSQSFTTHDNSALRYHVLSRLHYMMVSLWKPTNSPKLAAFMFDSFPNCRRIHAMGGLIQALRLLGYAFSMFIFMLASFNEALECRVVFPNLPHRL